MRLEFLSRLNGIEGVSISADKVTKSPWFYLSLLKGEAAMEQFLDTLDWVMKEIKRS